jgi:hypothetical protein
MQNVRITADLVGSESILRELSALAETSKFSPEIVNQIVGLMHGGLEVSGIETLTTFGTVELRVGLKLPDGLLELVSALRARTFDSSVFV